MVSSRVCGGRNDFNSEVVNILILDRDDPRSPSCSVCVSQLFHLYGYVRMWVTGSGYRFSTAGLHKAFSCADTQGWSFGRMLD